MKTLINLCLFIFLLVQSCLSAELSLPQSAPKIAKPFVLKGQIKCNEDWKNCPEFRLFFNGKQTLNDNEGFFSFPLEKQTDKYSILVCKNINPNFSNTNTIENLSLKIEKPYKIFTFKKEENDKKEIVWNKTEKNLENKNFVVPKNCIIALINPKYIQEVQNWEVKLTDNFTQGPKIVLKDDIDEKKTTREAANSVLRTLDSLPFHESIKTNKRDFTQHGNVKVTLAQSK